MWMDKNFSDFMDWLDREVSSGKLKRSEISKNNRVSRSAVTLLFKRTTKSLSDDMAHAIAAAGGYAVDDLYRRSGKLPPKIDLEDPYLKAQTAKLANLTGERREVATGLLDTLLKQEELARKVLREQKGEK